MEYVRPGKCGEPKLNEYVHRSARKSGWFEADLLDIQKRLPDGVYLEACITCAISDRNPTAMACSADDLLQGQQCGMSHGERQVRSFRIWSTATEYVQEAGLCPDFERRVPGGGYRG